MHKEPGVQRKRGGNSKFLMMRWGPRKPPKKWFLWAAPAPLHTAKHAAGSLGDKSVFNPWDRSPQHRKEPNFLQFFLEKKVERKPQNKARVGCSRVLLEGPIGNWGRKKGSLQRILTWSGAGPRGEAKRLGFLCSCAPTCLVTWWRSLGLGSPPPKWGRRESEPRSEWRKPRHPQDRRLKTEQRRVC